jgi:hypothetical protein
MIENSLQEIGDYCNAWYIQTYNRMD